MKYLHYPICLIGVISSLILPACKNQSGETKSGETQNIPSTPRLTVERPAFWDEDVEFMVYIDYSPNTTFTSINHISDIIPDDPVEYDYGVVNDQFLEGCYYTGDTSTPFLASFAERYNKTEFLRRFVNADELFERLNTNPDDSLTTETVRGRMPLLPDEYQLAFRNAKCQALAKKIVHMLTTIDYEPEQTEKMASYFEELVKIPYDTPDFISSEEMKALEEDFWTLYDKSKYVDKYDEILKMRIPEEVDYDELEKLSIVLQNKYLAEEDFDAKCIYALEMGCYDFPDIIGYLGELIEDGRYSKYLFEVWVSWRLRVQAQVFGISTWSEIPDNLYDKARLLVAQTYAKHIVENPDDTLAKMLLMNIIYTEHLHRFWGFYGNESLGGDETMRTMYFLPEELRESNDYEEVTEDN